VVGGGGGARRPALPPQRGGAQCGGGRGDPQQRRPSTAALGRIAAFTWRDQAQVGRGLGLGAIEHPLHERRVGWRAVLIERRSGGLEEGELAFGERQGSAELLSGALLVLGEGLAARPPRLQLLPGAIHRVFHRPTSSTRLASRSSRRRSCLRARTSRSLTVPGAAPVSSAISSTENPSACRSTKASRRVSDSCGKNLSRSMRAPWLLIAALPQGSLPGVSQRAKSSARLRSRRFTWSAVRAAMRS